MPVHGSMDIQELGRESSAIGGKSDLCTPFKYDHYLDELQKLR